MESMTMIEMLHATPNYMMPVLCNTAIAKTMGIM